MLPRVLVLCVCATSLSCTGPKATISDPRPYSLDMMLLAGAQVPAAFQSDQAFQRYFGQTPSAYNTSSLRLDRMLDTSQRASAFSQVSTASTAIKLSAAALPTTQPTKPPADGKDGQNGGGGGTDATKKAPTTPAEEVAKAEADAKDKADKKDGTVESEKKESGDDKSGKAKPAAPGPSTHPSIENQFDELRQAGQFIVADSPFDALDRVDDFYASAVLKFLRRGQDARTANVTSDQKWDFYKRVKIGPELKKLQEQGKSEGELKDAAQKLNADIELSRPFFDALTSGTYREYVLVQQATVEPGNVDNKMVGVRVKITAIDGCPCRDGDVLISRIHPARAYDLEPTTFLEDLSVSLALTGDIPVSEVAKLAVDRDASLKAEAKRQFISRLGKHGGVIDAAKKTYGWDFYPTNLRVERKNIFGLLFGLLIGTPQLYDVKSRLEPGGRDTAVWLLVPSTAKTLTCERWTVAGPVDGPGEIKQVGEVETFTVRLQPDDAPKAEADATARTPAIAPMTSETAAETTAPGTGTAPTPARQPRPDANK